MPHARDNYAVWSVFSDDDGVTWSASVRVDGVVEGDPSGPDCARNMSYFGVDDAQSLLEWVLSLGSGAGDPYADWADKLVGPWQFVGLGPPGALQLASGKVLVPGYHGYVRGLDGGGGAGAGIDLPVSQLYNNLALAHVISSDDGGDTWTLGSRDGFGGGAKNGSHGANEMQFVQ